MKYQTEKDQTEKHIDLDDKNIFDMDKEGWENDDDMDFDFPEEEPEDRD